MCVRERIREKRYTSREFVALAATTHVQWRTSVAARRWQRCAVVFAVGGGGGATATTWSTVGQVYLCAPPIDSRARGKSRVAPTVGAATHGALWLKAADAVATANVWGLTLLVQVDLHAAIATKILHGWKAFFLFKKKENK